MRDRVGDGVRIAGIDVGGLTASEAEAAWRSMSPPCRQSGWSRRAHKLNSTLADLGYSIDIQASAQAALARGRHKVAGLTVWLPGGGGEVPLVMRLDKGALETALQRVHAAVDVPAKDARLALNGETITVVPSTDGSGVDEAALARAIGASIAAGKPYAGSVPITAVPPQVSTADAQARAARPGHTSPRRSRCGCAT